MSVRSVTCLLASCTTFLVVSWTTGAYTYKSAPPTYLSWTASRGSQSSSLSPPLQASTTTSRRRFVVGRTTDSAVLWQPPSDLRSARRGGESSVAEGNPPMRSSDLDATSEATTTTHSSDPWWDKPTLLGYATSQGVELSLTTLGPAYRGVARSTHNQTVILAYVEGFVRPAGHILHMDKMEVFRPNVALARINNPDFTGGGTPLGVGLLVGHLCVLHGHEQGCQVAEFLAIDDSPAQHKRLVKLYRQAGFKVVKYVGDSWRDVPDRLVWGGCGTLLRRDVPTLLALWTKLMEKSHARQLQKRPLQERHESTRE